MPYYVITGPEPAKAIFKTWDECKAAQVDVSGRASESAAAKWRPNG